MKDRRLEKHQGAEAVCDDHDPIRRTILTAIGGTIGLAACGRQSDARAEQDASGEEEVFSSINRPKEFLNNELDGKPWVAPQTGNFELNDPAQNRFAKLKMSQNLIGKRTYIPMMVRIVMGREELPGGPILGVASMFVWQLQVPDPVEFPGLPEGTALLRVQYTARHLNPETMEPVERMENPFTGKMMEFEDYISIENLFFYPKGGTKMVDEEQFADDHPDEPKLVHIKEWGDDLMMFSNGVYSKPGVHQPRFTENTWTCSRDDVMDPDKHLIDAHYNFMGVLKAYEKPWTGYTTEDKEIFAVLGTGKKVHTVNEIPDFHKRVLLEKYPNRI